MSVQRQKCSLKLLQFHNEIRLYELLNITGLIFNLSEKEVVEKEGKPQF